MSGVVFLQGPLGPYFARCARYFSAQGMETHKINFNGGDRFFAWADHQVNYSGGKVGWSEYFRAYVEARKIQAVVVYGDCRFYHREARAVCERLDIAFWVFEEGYLRPDFVTLEQGGVNAFSHTDWSLPAINKHRSSGRKPGIKVGLTFWQRAWFATVYYLAASFARAEFPHYHHHRPRNWVQEMQSWLISFYRKGLYKITQRNYLPQLLAQGENGFYLLPLQTCDDFQLREHSDFDSMEQAVEQVIASFAANASAEALLVIKHHPMDRGFVHFGAQINSLARAAGVAGRVVYCHDLHLPTLLDHAKGVITINSTVGISALLHRVPTMVLGRALYDLPGLTHGGELDSFWQTPSPVDSALFKRFRTYLYEQTQLDGNFFKYINETVAATWLAMEPTLDVPGQADRDDEFLAA